jgi:hypothetical protein
MVQGKDKILKVLIKLGNEERIKTIESGDIRMGRDQLTSFK